jgi:hypothetical protein
MGAPAHTRKTRALAIEKFRHCGMVSAAFESLGLDRGLHYDWLKKFPDYREAFEQARGPVSDLILDEVVSRAIVGWDEPVYSGGKRAVDFVPGPNGPVEVPAVIRKKSDACLLALASARVDGFNVRRTELREVDREGNDKKLDFATVRAYMQSVPDAPSE